MEPFDVVDELESYFEAFGDGNDREPRNRLWLLLMKSMMYLKEADVRFWLGFLGAFLKSTYSHLSTALLTELSLRNQRGKISHRGECTGMYLARRLRVPCTCAYSPPTRRKCLGHTKRT
ncbi:hypothetical protein SAMN05216299_1273 [Nitrosospira sp. Nsp14]|nr:hypothetical protein SAMN05216299_1273 [Nitrosospira sp. Nsp14]